ncbi:hypothetical protein FRC07_011378 [Ceratobasidium sp. 392]|nr:hypothetical protein FRC07_011378 [Ceratobasidium sp. 392]
MFSKSQDVRYRLKQRYQQLGSELLWKSLDEVDVLGRTNPRERTTYGHTGQALCVNALSWSPDGELLLSSGDDCRLLVWKHDPSYSQTSGKLDTRSSSLNLRCVTAIRTGHTDNVFSAQLLATGSPLVATCARDRQVRIFDLEKAGGTSTKDIGYGVGEAGSEAMVHLLKCHTRQVKRVVTEQSPSTFLTVAGDHTVRQHDLRNPHTCPRCPAPLVKVPYALNALALSAITPWYFVVAGESKYGHLFDRRMIGRDMHDERGAGERLNGSNDLVTCVARFGREASREEHDSGPHVTGARMAQTNGHELLLSYSGDAVYQYSIYDTPPIQRTSSIVPNNKAKSPNRPRVRTGKSPNPEEPEAALESLLAEHMDTSSDEEEDEAESSNSDSDTNSDSDEMSEDEDETTSAVLDRPIILPIKDYRGAGNIRTVKDVNFLGPNDEFVTSGSDDGNWFLWSKKSGELLGIWEGDGSVVNMVEGHPFLPIVAVSGIDETVKIFEPTAGIKRKSQLSNAHQIIEENESANTQGFILDRSVISALQILRAAGRLPEIDGGPECPTQ